MASTLTEWKLSKSGKSQPFLYLPPSTTTATLIRHDHYFNSTNTTVISNKHSCWWITEEITVITCDGRIIIGTLVGHDQVQNLILNEAHERVYSIQDDVEQVSLGLYLIRGDNVALIGDAKDWKDDLKVDPLPEIHQHIQWWGTVWETNAACIYVYIVAFLKCNIICICKSAASLTVLGKFLVALKWEGFVSTVG